MKYSSTFAPIRPANSYSQMVTDKKKKKQVKNKQIMVRFFKDIVRHCYVVVIMKFLLNVRVKINNIVTCSSARIWGSLQDSIKSWSHIFLSFHPFAFLFLKKGCLGIYAILGSILGDKCNSRAYLWDFVVSLQINYTTWNLTRKSKRTWKELLRPEHRIYHLH